jgi:hypothetical protein
MHQQSARRAPSTATFPNPAEVADILQVSPQMVARGVEQGLLPNQHPLDGHRHSPTAIQQLAAFLVQEVRAA